MWAVLSTVLGFSMGARIAHGAHFGGLAAGVLVALALPLETVLQKRLTIPALALGVCLMLWGILGNLAWLTSDYRASRWFGHPRTGAVLLSSKRLFREMPL